MSVENMIVELLMNDLQYFVGLTGLLQNVVVGHFDLCKVELFDFVNLSVNTAYNSVHIVGLI